MFARMTTLQAKPENVEEVVEAFRQDVLPAARGRAGYQGGHFLIDRASGKIIAVSLWADEAAMRATSSISSQATAAWSARWQLTVQPVVEGFEVAASEMQG